MAFHKIQDLGGQAQRLLRVLGGWLGRVAGIAELDGVGSHTKMS